MMSSIEADINLRFFVPINMSIMNYFMFMLAATLLCVVIQQL